MPTIKNENIGRIVLAIDPIEALHKDVADAFEYAKKHKVILNQYDIANKRTFCDKVYKILSTRMVQGLYAVEIAKKKIAEGMTSDNTILLFVHYLLLLNYKCRLRHSRTGKQDLQMRFRVY